MGNHLAETYSLILSECMLFWLIVNIYHKFCKKKYKHSFVFYSVITVHLFTVTIYIHQLDATLFKKLYSFLKHI
jgi:hypothetical protein